MTVNAQWARLAQRDLRRILNEWDPIGVFDPGEAPCATKSADEYDDVRDELISVLLRGGGRSDVVAALRSKLTDRMGLAPSLVSRAVVDEICAWWEAARPQR